MTDRAAAPRQPDEGAPDAWLVFEDRYARALDGLAPGTDVLLLTWLDRADRDTLSVRPRGDTDRPLTGVFATRAPDRPNPIGLHTVRRSRVGVVRSGSKPNSSSVSAAMPSPRSAPRRPGRTRWRSAPPRASPRAYATRSAASRADSSSVSVSTASVRTSASIP
ncbi:TrmO family methyltransferase domain-containing protein [Streptomyces sp. NPDC002078]